MPPNHQLSPAVGVVACCRHGARRGDLHRRSDSDGTHREPGERARRRSDAHLARDRALHTNHHRRRRLPRSHVAYRESRDPRGGWRLIVFKSGDRTAVSSAAKFRFRFRSWSGRFDLGLKVSISTPNVSSPSPGQNCCLDFSLEAKISVSVGLEATILVLVSVQLATGFILGLRIGLQNLISVLVSVSAVWCR